MDVILDTIRQTHPTIKTPLNTDGVPYEEIDFAQINALRKQHAWIAEPLIRACDEVAKMPFFQWLEALKSPHEFLSAAQQLYYHSATFPKVMGLMLGISAMGENHMMPFYAKHAFSESDHHELLLQWMLKHSLLDRREQIKEVILSTETNACINQAYQLAIAQDRDMWIIAINCGIERCSNEFFKMVAPKMRELGAGDLYFDLHVEADEHHSIMGLKYLPQVDPNSFRAKQLVAKGLEAISLWAAMLHSWIDMDIHPKFNLDGSLSK